MKIVSALVGLLLGGLFGLVTALWAGGMIGSGVALGGQVSIDDWNSDWTIGSSAANPWTRARIARHGLLALTKAEAVYFTRNTDDTGARLQEACTYTVSGGAMPADWWSITLYDGASRLPDNTDNALSYDQTDAGAGSGDWTFTISPDPATDLGWVSSRSAGKFDLTLRLYRPSGALIDDPESVLKPPRIEKSSCRETT